MINPWYDVITGGHLWPVSINNIRHFIDVEPFYGALTLCGIVVGKDYNLEIIKTCDTCADKASNIRLVIEIPEPIPSYVEAVQSPLSSVNAILSELTKEQQQLFLSVAKSLADGNILLEDLV